MITKKVFAALFLSGISLHGMGEKPFAELFDQKNPVAREELAKRYQTALQAMIAHANRNVLLLLWDKAIKEPYNAPIASQTKKLTPTNRRWEHVNTVGCGIGTLKDFTPKSQRYEAMKNPHIQFLLAENFLHNPAIKNFNLAITLYRAAAEQGVAEAQAKVALYYRNKNDYVTNVYWLEKAAAQGYASSL